MIIKSGEVGVKKWEVIEKRSFLEVLYEGLRSLILKSGHKWSDTKNIELYIKKGLNCNIEDLKAIRCWSNLLAY